MGLVVNEPCPRVFFQRESRATPRDLESDRRTNMGQQSQSLTPRTSDSELEGRGEALNAVHYETVWGNKTSFSISLASHGRARNQSRGVPTQTENACYLSQCCQPSLSTPFFFIRRAFERREKQPLRIGRPTRTHEEREREREESQRVSLSGVLHVESTRCPSGGKHKPEALHSNKFYLHLLSPSVMGNTPGLS